MLHVQNISERKTATYINHVDWVIFLGWLPKKKKNEKTLLLKSDLQWVFSNFLLSLINFFLTNIRTKSLTQ